MQPASPSDRLAEPLLACGNCRVRMERLALPGHYGRRVELDLCAGCDLIWFDTTETAELSGPALLDLIGRMALSHALPHRNLRPDAACPRCSGGLRMVQNQSRWGRSSELLCERRHGAYQSFAQFLQAKGLLRPMSRLDRTRLLRDRGRIDCVNCGAAVALEDEFCSFCRSVPSLLDVARLARALDPAEAIGPQAVHAAPQRQSAIQCAACGAALPPGQTVACASCGATLAITSLAEVNAHVQALAPALRAAALKPPPEVVKRRLDALDADLPRRREWVARMEAESRSDQGAEPSFGLSWLWQRGTSPYRALLVALALWFLWRHWH